MPSQQRDKRNKLGQRKVALRDGFGFRFRPEAEEREKWS
jgi:hypothetical protein